MATLPRSSADPERLVAELDFLSQLCAVVASSTDLQSILDWIVQKTTAMFGADEGSIKLLGPALDSVKTRVVSRAAEISSGSWPTDVSMHVMGFLMSRNEALATPDLTTDTRFQGLRNAALRFHSVLAVPLKVDNRFTGLLAVTTVKPGRQWTADEMKLLAIVASNSAAVIEQARLREESRERQRLEEEAARQDRELDHARATQMALVPSRPLVIPPWEVMGRIVPARKVGGDAFDYFPLGADRFAVAIADVSGKGIPASLLMSNVQGALRAFCNGRLPVPMAVQEVNRTVARNASSGKFITFFYAEIDIASGRVHYCNAGHNFPLVRRGDGTLTELKEGGLPLGIIEDSAYDQGTVELAPGDSLLLFSDGIPEALNERQEEFGDARLQKLWSSGTDVRPGEIIDGLISDVAAFRGRADQSDDITAVVATRRPS
jgi:sigma-B regulation protein RsbU (phosphoserine phosphatase)